MQTANTHILFNEDDISRPHPSMLATLVGTRRVGARPSALNQRSVTGRIEARKIKFLRPSKCQFVYLYLLFNLFLVSAETFKKWLKKELLKTDQDATTIVRRGKLTTCWPNAHRSDCFYVYSSAAVLLGITEDELGHRLTSLEEFFAASEEVTLCCFSDVLYPFHSLFYIFIFNL